MIEIRSVHDELDRFDELHRERLCVCCAYDPEAQGSDLRRAFERAAARGDARFLRCANCGSRWTPEQDINHAVGGWVMVLSDSRLIAALCGPCVVAHPEPAKTLPAIARLLLEKCRGPVQ